MSPSAALTPIPEDPEARLLSAGLVWIYDDAGGGATLDRAGLGATALVLLFRHALKHALHHLEGRLRDFGLNASNGSHRWCWRREHL